MPNISVLITIYYLHNILMRIITLSAVSVVYKGAICIFKNYHTEPACKFNINKISHSFSNKILQLISVLETNKSNS